MGEKVRHSPGGPARVTELHPPSGRLPFRSLGQRHYAQQYSAPSLAYEVQTTQIALGARYLSHLFHRCLCGVDGQKVGHVGHVERGRVQVDSAGARQLRQHLQQRQRHHVLHCPLGQRHCQDSKTSVFHWLRKTKNGRRRTRNRLFLLFGFRRQNKRQDRSSGNIPSELSLQEILSSVRELKCRIAEPV